MLFQLIISTKRVFPRPSHLPSSLHIEKIIFLYLILTNINTSLKIYIIFVLRVFYLKKKKLYPFQHSEAKAQQRHGLKQAEEALLSWPNTHGEYRSATSQKQVSKINSSIGLSVN